MQKIEGSSLLLAADQTTLFSQSHFLPFHPLEPQPDKTTLGHLFTDIKVDLWRLKAFSIVPSGLNQLYLNGNSLTYF